MNRFSRLAAAAALLATVSLAHALSVVPYSAQALAAAQKAGQPVVLDFHASWCPTCRRQDKAFEELSSDPSLKITILQADFDQEKALERQLKVNAQSTLIVYHGAEERTRSTGETDTARLKALLLQAGQ